MKLRSTIISALMLALALLLPFVTGQIPTIGNMLLPMHIPIIICGFICGWRYGGLIGFIAPILRGMLFGMPPLMPVGLAMAFELSAYGVVCGLMWILLKKKFGYSWISIYGSLISAILVGRVVWGIARLVIAQLFEMSFSWQIFLSGAFLTAIPGIIVQLVLIPILILSLKKEALRYQETI